MRRGPTGPMQKASRRHPRWRRPCSGDTCVAPTMPPMSQPAPEKSWQARIGEATDALAQSFVESISYDRRLYKHDIAGSIAHATMLAKVGLITEQDRDAIEKGLKEIERDIESGNLDRKSTR